MLWYKSRFSFVKNKYDFASYYIQIEVSEEEQSRDIHRENKIDNDQTAFY